MIALAMMLLSSCYTAKKANKDIYKVHVNYPELLAKYCSEEFRSDRKDSVVKGDEIVSTDTIYSTDTQYVDCPPTEPDKPSIKMPCPPNKTVKESKSRVDTTYKEFPENLAKIKHLTNENEKFRNENTKLQEDKVALKNKVADLRKKLIKTYATIGGLILLIAVGLYLKFKPF